MSQATEPRFGDGPPAQLNINTTNSLEAARRGKKGGKHFPPPPPFRTAASVDEFRPRNLYTKHSAAAASSSSGNGSVGVGSRIKQNSKSSLLAATPPSPSVASSGPLSQSNGAARPSSTVVDQEKVLAAKKRRQESVDKKKETVSGGGGGGRKKRSCKQRLQVFATISVSVMLILSGASLLFACLIIVDPIVVGLRAQFKQDPGLCRTVLQRNVTGPTNCVMPSCREGCTADLYTCTFIMVVYYEYSGLNVSIVEDEDGVQSIAWDEDSLPPGLLDQVYPDPNSEDNSTTYYNATLMINPNGCGYPPDVNCSLFEERFLRPGTLFPCFYSYSYFNEINSRVAVPFYSRDTEMANLGMSLGIPLGSMVLLSAILFLLLRWKAVSRKRRNTITEIRTEDPRPAFTAFSKSAQFRDSFGQDTRTLSLSSRPNSTRNSSIKANNGNTKLNGHGPKKKEPDRPGFSLNNGSLIGDLVDNLVKGKTPMLGQLARTHFSNGATTSSMQADDEDATELISLPSSSTGRPLPPVIRSLQAQTSLR